MSRTGGYSVFCRLGLLLPYLRFFYYDLQISPLNNKSWDPASVRNSQNMFQHTFLSEQEIYGQYTDKKKIKFSSEIRKFRMEQLQGHI